MKEKNVSCAWSSGGIGRFRGNTCLGGDEMGRAGRGGGERMGCFVVLFFLYSVHL